MEFSAASGHMINYAKSTIFFSMNSHRKFKRMLIRNLKFHQSSSLDKYLGTNLLINKNKKQVFSSLLNQFPSKLLKWQTNLLSQAGRSIVISSIVAPVPRCQIQCFAIPKA